MDDRLLTGYQALQLLALGPCIFVLVFMCLTMRRFTQALVPMLFFFSLACSFCIPLLDSLELGNGRLKALLLICESMSPALIFLLVYQFVSGAVPPVFCWMILTVPLVGGGVLGYATLVNSDTETCVWGRICMMPQEFKELYEVFSSAVTMLLTIIIFNRIERSSAGNPKMLRTTNALVSALILLNALLLGIELGRLGELVTADRAEIAVTVVRIGFIYLVLTSIFRVFDRSFEIDFGRVPTLQAPLPTDKERDLADKIKALLEKEKLYRTMDLSREKLAKQMAVTEHALSRAVNNCSGKSISALINQYRVQEARERLAREETAITVIAFEVGFNSIPSFNRVFKTETGMSPTAFRATNAKA